MIGLFLACMIAGPHDNPKKIALQIYEEMLDTYSSCDTYSDTGSMTSGDDRITFVTRFHRPTKFYFEFTEVTDEKNRYVLWCPGSAQAGNGAYLETHTWDTRDRGKESTALGSAVAGFTGISRGTACNVPRMLLPGEIGIGNLADIKDIAFDRTETVRGELCDVISSKDQDVKLWISQKTHLIWRIEESLGGTAEVSDYSPSLNQEIRDSLFIFTPPKKGLEPSANQKGTHK